jgi:hypothetical protein
VLVDRQDRIRAVVVSVGGFLGIGQKDVTIPFDQVQWMSGQEVPAAANSTQGRGYGTDAAEVNAPGSDPNMPTGTMVKMTKADLQNAPEFYYSNAANRSTAWLAYLVFRLENMSTLRSRLNVVWSLRWKSFSIGSRSSASGWRMYSSTRLSRIS